MMGKVQTPGPQRADRGVVSGLRRRIAGDAEAGDRAGEEGSDPWRRARPAGSACRRLARRLALQLGLVLMGRLLDRIPVVHDRPVLPSPGGESRHVVWELSGIDALKFASAAVSRFMA